MKRLILLTALLVSQAEALVVTSLNIEWFGRGGEIFGSAADEYRGERLKDYITNVLPDSDVYVFQEITDREAFFEIMKGFDCISYDAGIRRHQHIVMCSKEGLLKNHSVNHDVRLERKGLRAALIGDYEIDGEMVRVIGVHLKAGWKETDMRLDQIEALKKDLDKRDVIVVGDFNTYKKDRTERLYDDSVLISESLGYGFALVENEVPTYMSYYKRVFDRAWFKGNFVNAFAQVFGPCKQDSVKAPYSHKDFYTRFISDHCALSIEVN